MIQSQQGRWEHWVKQGKWQTPNNQVADSKAGWKKTPLPIIGTKSETTTSQIRTRRRANERNPRERSNYMGGKVLN